MTLAVMMWRDFKDEAPYGLTYFAIGYMTNVISYLSLAFLLYDGNKYFVGFWPTLLMQLWQRLQWSNNLLWLCDAVTSLHLIFVGLLSNPKWGKWQLQYFSTRSFVGRIPVCPIFLLETMDYWDFHQDFHEISWNKILHLHLGLPLDSGTPRIGSYTIGWRIYIMETCRLVVQWRCKMKYILDDIRNYTWTL